MVQKNNPRVTNGRSRGRASSVCTVRKSTRFVYVGACGISTHCCQGLIEMQDPPSSLSSQYLTYIPDIVYNNMGNSRAPIMFSRDSFFAARVPLFSTDLTVALAPPYFAPERAKRPIVSRACGRTTTARCHPLLAPSPVPTPPAPLVFLIKRSVRLLPPNLLFPSTQW